MCITPRLQSRSHKRQRVSSPLSDSSVHPVLLPERPYQHFSDLRTTYDPTEFPPKKQRRVLQPEDMQEPCCAPAIDVPATLPNCTECVQECEEGACDVQLTEQCTDKCVVVPCHDAHPEFPKCDASSFLPHCDEICAKDDDCSALDNFLQCCTTMDYQQLVQDAKAFQDAHLAPNLSHWPTVTFDDIFQGFAGQPQPTASNSLYYIDSSSSTPQMLPSPSSFMHSPSTVSSPGSQFSSLQNMSTVGENSATTISHPHRCKWADCSVGFASMNELVGHVNLQHLRLSSADGPADPSVPAVSVISQPQSAQSSMDRPADHFQTIPSDPASLACLWEDCRVYPTPNSIPGPSIGNQTDNVLGVLASHLLQDHLGLPTRTSSPTSFSFSSASVRSYSQHEPPHARSRAPSEVKETKEAPLNGVFSTPSPPASCPPTPAPEHDCSAPHAHTCRWTGCGESFSSCDALTAHINAAHVGGGKAHYDCHWEGCGRNGENGFASKQKICRHLQSHTGHRPFQCTTCQQNFSEAATLQQHMRRHTREKPYTCDFPGCGKAFAITGALTIHKRTHYGHKPFKCTYCEKAFTESSNLSKHLRTHTGARPYSCTEPGCSKNFARPDQLQRHVTTHRKKDMKAVKVPPPAQVATVAAVT